jgi:hypothetical protein
MKNIVKIMMFSLFSVLFFVACAGHAADYIKPQGDVRVEIVDYANQTIADDTNQAEIIEPASEPSGPIAIITDEWMASRVNPWGSDLWFTELVGRYSPIIYTWPSHHNFTAQATSMINEIARNPEIRVLVVNSAWHETSGFMGILREQREDIFIIYIDRPGLHAHLFLELNELEMARNFAIKAWELGAQTLVYFYDSSPTWIWTADEIIKGEHEETDRQILLREKSEELGLSFIEFDIEGAIQCGSSYAAFMGEALPPLIEKYGPNLVLFGLDNERVWWSWSENFIYLPVLPSWHEFCPISLAFELRIIEGFRGDMPHNSQLIEEIRAALDARGLRGRVATLPISTQILFSVAAAEYGLKWANGEVPKEGIDLYVLEQIMTGLIAEYTGFEHDINLTAHAKNHILISLDYFVY